MKSFFLMALLLLLSSVFLFANIEKTNELNEEELSFFRSELITEDTFYVQTNNCAGVAEVCIDIPFENISDYTFSEDGMMYNGGFVGCMDSVSNTYDYGQLFGQGNLGPYSIDEWQIDGNTFSGIFNTIPDLVDSMNLWDPMGDWILDIGNMEITGGNSNSTYASMEVTVVSISAPTSIPLIQNTISNGSQFVFGVGTHLIQILETGGGLCIDSFFVHVVCVQPSIENYTLAIGDTENLCFDNSELLGVPLTTEILCPDGNGSPADFDLVMSNTCVDITAVGAGQDSVCYVFCDQFGICDTTTIHVNVLPDNNTNTDLWVYDTIFQNISHQICIDTFQFAGNTTSMNNDCPDLSGEFVLFTFDANTYCVDYSGIDIGKDTACIFVYDDLGNVDTTYLEVCVTNPSPLSRTEILELGSSERICLDTTQLGGIVTSIENICENPTDDIASFIIDEAALCVDIVTNGVGQDSACLVICDNFGVCDTTYVFVNITDGSSSTIVANDDFVTTLVNEDVMLNVCTNDNILNGFLINYYILSEANGGVGPTMGEVEFDSECNIIYSPNREACDLDDRFNYVICNADGCDTATVTVSVMCEAPETQPLEFATGFSPNGDEVNQYFTIKGAETYPDNSLQVFNRWGNQVFKTDNYQNDWEGTWRGSSLQNGTYFFIFDDGIGNKYTGYLYIQR